MCCEESDIFEPSHFERAKVIECLLEEDQHKGHCFYPAC